MWADSCSTLEKRMLHFGHRLGGAFAVLWKVEAMLSLVDGGQGVSRTGI